MCGRAASRPWLAASRPHGWAMSCRPAPRVVMGEARSSSPCHPPVTTPRPAPDMPQILVQRPDMCTWCWTQCMARYDPPPLPQRAAGVPTLAHSTHGRQPTHCGETGGRPGELEYLPAVPVDRHLSWLASRESVTAALTRIRSNTLWYTRWWNESPMHSFPT